MALMVKNLPTNAGDLRDSGLIPGLGRSPGGGHGNPIQHSCLEKPMNRGAWRAAVHSVAKSQTWLKLFSMHTHTTPYQHKCFCGGESVSCSAVSSSLWPHGLPARLLCLWNAPGKNARMDCHSLLQGIFQTQELNQGLQHYRQILYHLSHQESPQVMKWMQIKTKKYHFSQLDQEDFD